MNPDASLASAHAHCESLVRQEDRAAWTATLFAPAAARPHLHALDAFAIEIGHVKARVHQPLAGEIRLQWWRDAIAGEARGDATSNPVAAALLDAVRRVPLSTDVLDQLIEAHRLALYDPENPPLPTLEERLAGCEGSLLASKAQALGAALPDDRLAASAGVAIGAARLLASTSAAPDGTLALARHHLATFRQARGRLPDAALPAFLPVSLVEPTLRRFERGRRPATLPTWRQQWTLWRAARRDLR